MKTKPEPVTKYLARRFGGKWYYDPSSRWWLCSDGDRYVCRVAVGRDFEGEYTGESRMCMYHKASGKTPEWV
jgi:hypothetical protein